MRRKNLYYAQLGEAIALAQSDIFEYKRISLILFDNIVENLLQSQNYQKLRHKLVMSEIKKEEFDKIIISFEEFDSIVKYAKTLNVINEKEKQIIKCCHKARNKLYHSLFEDSRITDFCILFYSNFLERNFTSFLEIGITSYSDNENKSTNEIIQKEGVSNLSDIIKNLEQINISQSVTPQAILSNIICDFIEQFKAFYKCDSKESWDELNRIARDQYFYDYEIKQEKHKNIDVNELIHVFRKKWYNLDSKKINILNESASQLKKLNVEDAFEKFTTIFSKLNPIYIGIMLYYSEQEYIASLNED